MKRIIAAILITMTVLALCACAKTDAPVHTPEPETTDAPEIATPDPDSPEAILGTWKIDPAATLLCMTEEEGFEFEEGLRYGFDMSLTFATDNTGSMTVKNGQAATVTDFTFTVKYSVLTMYPESGGSDSRMYEFADGKLYLWKSGSALVFVRA